MTEQPLPRIPVYRQVARQLAEEIISGKRPVNSKIPSERELAERFHISRMTARAALNVLLQRGLIARRSHSGAYVAQPKYRFDLSSPGGLHDQLRQAGVEPGAKLITASVSSAKEVNPQVAQKLKLTEDEEVYHIIRLRTANGEPIALENSFFPVRLFPELLDFNLTDSIYGILKKYFAVEPAESFQELEISLLDVEWAALMEIPAGLPTLEIRRTTITAEGELFEYAHDIYRGDRILFTARTVTEACSSLQQVWQHASKNL